MSNTKRFSVIFKRMTDPVIDDTRDRPRIANYVGEANCKITNVEMQPHDMIEFTFVFVFHWNAGPGLSTHSMYSTVTIVIDDSLDVFKDDPCCDKSIRLFADEYKEIVERMMLTMSQEMQKRYKFRMDGKFRVGKADAFRECKRVFDDYFPDEDEEISE